MPNPVVPEGAEDRTSDCEMADAAVSYIRAAVYQVEFGRHPAMPMDWPWAERLWTPSADPIANLHTAAALVAAEIDRLQAKEASPDA
jgi:hypothetical protein